MKSKNKGTWYRKLRALDLRTDRRQQQRDIIPKVVDDTARVCSNCGHEYTGRLCPQCGQAGTWDRYTWHQAFLNFLDIWGLGNRPMFRTLKELFWRPGYMIRDYLNGHRQFYFPPFKLLAIVVVLLISVSWLTGVKVDSLFNNDGEELAQSIVKWSSQFTGAVSVMGHMAAGFVEFLSRNLLYEWLFMAIIEVICIWVVFRPKSKYNLVETYIFVIYVICQGLLLMVPELLGGCIYNWVEKWALPVGNNAATTVVANGVLLVFGLIAVAYSLIGYFYVVLDFKQFYGLKWKIAVWYIFKAMVFGLLLLALIAFVVYGLFHSVESRVLVFLLIILMPLGYYLGNRVIQHNKQQVPGQVIKICSWSLLSLLIAVVAGTAINSIAARVAVVVGLFVVLLLLSLSPIYLYKKFHRMWLCWLPPVVLIIAAIVAVAYLK